MKLGGEKQAQQEEVRYCVTAVVDLLGFSAHLEVGGHDVRTTIGREAVTRLQTLEDGLRLIEAERELAHREYPAEFSYIRINDALILSMDLPPILMPSVGESIKQGFTGNDLGRFFDLGQYEDEDDFRRDYQDRLAEEVSGLIQFIGIIARLHSYIHRREAESYFPGARTIVATGYRRPFSTGKREDFLAANFSFSNAYVAEQHLKGARLFLDNNVAQLLCANRFACNLLRYACWVRRDTEFDPLDDHEDVLWLSSEWRLSTAVDVTLFRKSFRFREVDAQPLGFLQVVPRTRHHLEWGGESPTDQEWPRLRSLIRNGPDRDLGASTTSNPFPLSYLRNDLVEDIRTFSEFVETGDSAILREKISSRWVITSALPAHG
jgi:hypothetical protein